MEFIEKCEKIHKNRFDYSLVEYKKSDVKVKIICPDHGEFLSSPSVHLRTKTGGCPKCIGYKSLTEFLNICRNIHGDKYDYSLVSNIRNNRTKLDIICNQHVQPFKFTQRYFNHINRKQGCPLCAGRYSYDYKEFINKANKIHNFK